MRSDMRLTCLLGLAAGLLSAAGCGDSQARVQGRVTFGGQAIETGVVTFIPEVKSQGPSAGAPISQGTYLLQGNNLPPPGAYRVEIRAQKKTGKQVPAGSPSPPGKMIDEMVDYIPPRYNKDSELKVTLKAGSNKFDFDLQPQ